MGYNIYSLLAKSNKYFDKNQYIIKLKKRIYVLEV